MNTKAKGARAERALKKKLEEMGYIVVRSAASLTFDLVAINPNNGHTFLIEVKSIQKGYWRPRNKQEKSQIANLSRCNNWVNSLYALIAVYCQATKRWYVYTPVERTTGKVELVRTGVLLGDAND